MTTRWLGYHRIRHGSGEVFDTVDLFLPDVQFATQVLLFSSNFLIFFCSCCFITACDLTFFDDGNKLFSGRHLICDTPVLDCHFQLSGLLQSDQYLLLQPQAAYMRVPPAAKAAVKAAGLPWREGLHAASHAVLNVIPLHLLCEPIDMGCRTLLSKRDQRNKNSISMRLCQPPGYQSPVRQLERPRYWRSNLDFHAVHHCRLRTMDK